ncbi:MAG: SgcJ/EcaC family oxidoreductase [bacterium]
MTDANQAADEKAIRDLDEKWGDAATAHDLEGVVSFYAPDGSLVWPDTPAVHGTAGIRSAWKEMYDTMPGLGLRFVADTITISASGDLAADFGAVHLTMDGPDGKKVSDVAKYVVTWQKLNGEWKVLYDVWNENHKS